MHWAAWLAIVALGWLFVAVVGGWILGRGLGALERQQGRVLEDSSAEMEPHELRRAA